MSVEFEVGRSSWVQIKLVGKHQYSVVFTDFWTSLGKRLSAAGKEILLKAVLQAIPTYSMGLFLLPYSITQKLNKLLRKFWWGFSEETTKIQWVSWDQLSSAKEVGGLGFRDFRMFNLALLAKQSWRILQEPTSLAARVLKQKYFNSGELLNARLGTGPSYVWRSVMAGLSILKPGLRWRVGNGKSINIWTDKWIPSLPSGSVASPREMDCWCEMVSDLINPSQRSWKKELLQEMFSEPEIQGITSIPISLGGREDKMFWSFTANGMYTVKSGYHHQRQVEALESTVWKKIWQLKVAPAVKIFIWKVCNEAIPTLANLKKRRVVEDSSCIVCKSEPETSSHVLWGCPAATDVWNQACVKIQKMSFHSDQFFKVWAMLVQKLEVSELEEAAVTLRGIWSRRNDLVHGKDFKHPSSLYQGAKLEAIAFIEANLVGENPQLRSERSLQTWSKPNDVIIRDHQGFVVGTLRAPRPLNGGAYEAEACGLFVAVTFCRELGLSQVILEGDSRQVVTQLLGQEVDGSMGGWEANSAAHVLAKSAVLLSEDLYNIEECPECITSIVTSEMLLN
ncbi:hypothetical protein I3842_03G106200 [Carya illinoinensis]|uniref:Reverse transcriptase zinc-binding domain-containing protein n=1 Tax=Carya illinoinensis TaxID=32201 RepID=A0A922FF39_CARIL|nr:hypothetical protein I3842_03G106200 [Carya illinoinensis]